MKQMRIAVLGTCLVFLVGFSALSCNSAPDGFYAPVGSEITLPEDATATLGPGASLVFVTTIQVEVPTGTEPIGASENPPTTQMGPGNDIYTTAFCTMCTILVWADGTANAGSDISTATNVGNWHTFTTNKRGSYTLGVLVVSPDVLGVDSYQANFAADIGVVSKTMLIEVSKLEASE